MHLQYIFGIFLIIIGVCIVLNNVNKLPSLVEHYRDPIYLNRQKYACDWYPRANGTIYGERSHIMSGFPYYFKAY